MGGNLPPHVDDGAHYLDEQCRHEDARHKAGDAQPRHEIIAGEVAEDGNGVGHHAALLDAYLQRRPALITVIEVDEQRGHEDGKQIDHAQHQQFVCPGE